MLSALLQIFLSVQPHSHRNIPYAEHSKVVPEVLWQASWVSKKRRNSSALLLPAPLPLIATSKNTMDWISGSLWESRKGCVCKLTFCRWIDVKKSSKGWEKKSLFPHNFCADQGTQAIKSYTVSQEHKSRRIFPRRNLEDASVTQLPAPSSKTLLTPTTKAQVWVQVYARLYVYLHTQPRGCV